MFKTDKQLGGRAIVTDTFSRPGDWNEPAELGRGPFPGQGWWAHRDGYNVLYGDWHAAWYGDPQQNILWWSTVQGNATSDNIKSFSGTMNSNVADWTGTPGID